MGRNRVNHACTACCERSTSARKGDRRKGLTAASSFHSHRRVIVLPPTALDSAPPTLAKQMVDEDHWVGNATRASPGRQVPVSAASQARPLRRASRAAGPGPAATAQDFPATASLELLETPVDSQATFIPTICT